MRAKDIQIGGITPSDYPELTAVWERAVRTTHDFLDEADLQAIKNSLPTVYFPQVEVFAAYDRNVIAGFVGLSDHRIEMLFVDERYQGQGIGSALMDFALSRGVDSVDVNEQNPEALAFYQKKGLHVVGRDETDSDGRPYPILHLRLRR